MTNASPKSTLRPRRRILVAVSAALLLAVGGSAGAVVAASLNADTRSAAALSAERGDIGDSVSLDLGISEAEDVYAASIRVTYDASLLAIDPDAIASEFNGMWSAVGRLDGDQGIIDFAVTRLGTSDGLADSPEMGSLDFVALAAGSAAIEVDTFELVSSNLERVSGSDSHALTFTVDAPVLPEPSPPIVPSVEPVPTGSPGPAPSQPTVRPVPQENGNWVRSGGSGLGGSSSRTYAAPQLDAPQERSGVVSVVVTPNPVAAGEMATFALSGAQPGVEHQFELVAGERALGATRTDAAGTANVTVEMPDDLSSGEHEVAVIAGNDVVASAIVSVTATEQSAPSPSPSEVPEVAGGAPDGDQSEAESVSDSNSVWPWIVGAGLLAAVVMGILALMARRSRAGASQ